MMGRILEYLVGLVSSRSAPPVTEKAEMVSTLGPHVIDLEQAARERARRSVHDLIVIADRICGEASNRIRACANKHH